MRFAVALVAVAALGQEAELKNPHTTPADLAAGARIFRSHCAECHGVHGEGGRGPNLATGVFFHGSTDADLYRNVGEGIPGTAMPGSFSPPDRVWQVVAYVRALAQKGSRSRPAGDPARGAKLFRDQGCITCHLVRGEGGVQGPDLSFIGSQRSVEYLREALLDPNASVSREYWIAKISTREGAAYSGFLMNEDTHVAQILDFSKGLKSLPKADIRKFELDKHSIMPSYTGRLPEDEINHLVAYLWSLQRGGSQ